MHQLVCHADSSKPLLSFQGKVWSQADFIQEVDRAEKTLLENEATWNKEEFILLNTMHPVIFYAYLIALIKQGNRVLVPNRDFFHGTGHPITYAAKILTPQDNSIKIEENPHFVKTSIPRGNIIVFSSGSTGIPKGIVHNFDNFIINASSVLKKIQFKESQVNITWLSPYLVSAISHFLCHWMSDSLLIFDDFSNLKELSNVASQYKTLGVMGSPVHITNAITVLPQAHAPNYFFSSGDVLSKSAANGILNKFPQAKLFIAYGLAEVAGRFFINTIENDSTYTGDLGSAIDGYTPIIEDEKIFVDSKYLFDGYIINGTYCPSQKRHDSGDIVFTEDDKVYLVGRSNDEIKVLGNKINLKYLETKIKNILHTDDLILVSTYNEALGNLISLVALQTYTCSRKEIMEKLREKMEKYELPHYYYTVPEFYFTQSMKVDRKRLASELNTFDKIL